MTTASIGLVLEPDVDGEVARLETLGAVRSEAARTEHGSRWIVMTDPEGNEFCVCNGGANSQQAD